MKIAISLPDRLFHEAEALAKLKGISRSELYTRGLQLFLQSQQAEYVTEALNAIYADEANSLDPALRATQDRVIARDPW
jgi:metal-responsive CopG/Arc/MetJ family transcriptional regulator